MSYCTNTLDEESCTEFYLTNVEETENLVAFNPYQSYSLKNNVTKLDLSAENNQLQEIIFETSRGEVPFATKFSVDQLPENVTLSETGMITKADNYTAQENYSDIQLTVSHDYVSSQTFTLPVTDSSYEVTANEEESNDEQDETQQPVERKMDKTEFVWKDCQTTLNDENFDQVICVVDDTSKMNKCVVFNTNMPSDLVPTDYADHKQNQQLFLVTPSSEITLPEELHKSGENDLLSKCD